MSRVCRCKDFLAKFKREAEAVANITHPNIVNVYDVGQEGKVHYIVMEYVDGQNLKEIIKNEGVLDEYTASCYYKANSSSTERCS